MGWVPRLAIPGSESASGQRIDGAAKAPGVAEGAGAGVGAGLDDETIDGEAEGVALAAVMVADGDAEARGLDRVPGWSRAVAITAPSATTATTPTAALVLCLI